MIAAASAALPPGPGLAWLLAAALAGGLARGFSGFGAALIFVPLASVALGPQRAAPLMLLLEALAVAALTPGAWRIADRREVGWLALGALLGTPLGAAVLLRFDPLTLRWGVALVVLALGREGATARRIRASFALYLAAGGVFAGMAYAAAGLLDAAALAGPFLAAAPVYAVGIWGGVRMFGLASEATFRRACYAMIALAALLSLPAWDGVLR